MPRKLVGSLTGVAAAAGLGAAMLPVRSHLAIATAALVLVIPVVGGVVVGGWTAGLVSAFAGFFVYDFVFIPPYFTWRVTNYQDWVAAAVYVVVVIVIARLVSHLQETEEAASSREMSARNLLHLSERLLPESPDIEQAVVVAIRDAFGIEGVGLIRPVNDHLEVVASAGAPISPDELARLRTVSHLPVSLTTRSSVDPIQTLALVSSGRPIGLLALRNTPRSPAVRDALPIMANHVAIALERSELRKQAHRAELLEEVDRLRQDLVGAVSHDLRTPLATIKVASSTLMDSAYELAPADLDELHRLIDQQADRLDRLVNNLLDMTRIQAGSLEVRRQPTQLDELISDTALGLRSILENREIRFAFSDPLPEVNIDPVLIGQVLANLLDNANRHVPAGTPITVEVSEPKGDTIVVTVADEGPGVPENEREAIFERFIHFDTGGRSGLGLAIAKAFVEAHGSRIWVESPNSGGARFSFTLPVLSAPSKAVVQ